MLLFLLIVNNEISHKAGFYLKNLTCQPCGLETNHPSFLSISCPTVGDKHSYLSSAFLEILNTSMGWIFVCPRNSYVEAWVPNMMALRGGAFGRKLGHDSGTLMNGSRADLLIRDRRGIMSLHYMKIQLEIGLESRKRALTRNQIDHGLSISQYWKNKCFLF